MNWLNKLDDVLDKALTPQNSRHGGSSSARQGQKPALTVHLADQFGNESDSSHDSPRLLPSRSLEVAGPSVPGRVRRRRSEGVAIPSPGNKSNPAVGNPRLPVVPGQVKRNPIQDTTEKQQLYPGNIKRRINLRNQAEESQDSSDFELELPAASQQSSSPIKMQEIENQQSDNLHLPVYKETYIELNPIEFAVSDEASVVAMETEHDEKQNGHVEMQQVVENELGQKALQADGSSSLASTTNNIVQSISSLAKTKAWGFLQGDRNHQKAEEHDANIKRASLEELPGHIIDKESDRLQIDTRDASDISQAEIMLESKVNKDTELSTRDKKRDENGGMVVALFSDDKDETRFQLSYYANSDPPGVQNIHEGYNLPAHSSGVENENVVERRTQDADKGAPKLSRNDPDSEYVAQTDKETSSTPSNSESRRRLSSSPPVKNSLHPAAVASTQIKSVAEDMSPVLKLVDVAREDSTTKLDEQIIAEETALAESSERLVPLSSGHDLGNDELPFRRKDQYNPSDARGIVTDSPFTLKPAVRNGSRTASEKGIESPHRSASLTKSDVDVDSTISIWSNFKLEMPFDRSRNCYGMVNLRLLCARRLSCSIGSFVQGSVSLKPWKGKVRTKSTRTYSGSKGEHGVCAVWDDCDENRVSMIHAFSSAESPIPTIEIDLTVSPLGMGLLGMSMGTLSLSCEELLMNPYRACRYWLTINDHTIPSAARLASPMLQVEAMFEPTTVEDEIVTEVQILPPQTIDIPNEVFTFQSANSGIEEYPSTPQRVGSKCGTSTPLSEKTPPFSSKSQRSMRSQTNQHLLRLRKFRLPATCCVCKKNIMSGIRAQSAYRCEKCKIDCCDDCILQVDIKMPCGSLAAQDVTKNSIQNKLSLNSILNTVAPISGTSPRRDNELSSQSVNVGASKGIGSIDLVFLRAFVLDEPWSPESDAADILVDEKTTFQSGDYYMRITRVGSKDSARTQTIQNSSKPVFNSVELVLDVPHYGSEFRIDLVDALTDKPVGSSILTTQSLLQLQRDDAFGEIPFRIVHYLRSICKIPQKIQLRIDLRHDMKDATTFEYFSPPNPSPHSAQVQKGDIVGYTDIQIVMKEDYASLYGDNPYECPPRPPDELNMRLFQLHLTRLSNFIETVKDYVNGYIYVISWKNPVVTASSFFVSLQICAAFNPAFLGSLPCFFVVVFMVTSALRHFCYQNEREMYMRKEIEKRRKEENIVLEQAIHRPVGEIGIAISAGRNISSLDFGIPGSVVCQAFWNPEGLMSSTERDTKKRPVIHEIGSTDRVYSTNPVWKEAKESSLTKRLRSVKRFNRETTENAGSADMPQFNFPVLQPFNIQDTGLPVLEPWESSLGTIDVEVGFTDLISILPDSESSAGVISIPFVEVYNQTEIKGWFKLQKPGRESAPCNPMSDDDGSPQVFLRIWWMPPVGYDNNGVDKESDTRREESVFIQEEMIRSSIIQGQSRRGVIGSSLGAISSVRGLTGHLAMVQNTLGRILDTAEAICNALTFTDPLKSSVLLGIAICLWIFFSLISVKVILYVLVVGQYGGTFMGRFGPLLFNKSETIRKKNTSPSPVGIWVKNAFRGIPTIEDLRRTYFWESLRRGVREAEQFSEEKRGKRLKMLFRARWYSSIQILSSSGDRWKTCFAIIQGHRFTWWSSVNDFDEGGKPLGSIFLSGHSGLATPSPLELKQLSSDNLDRLVCIFGRGIDKQERLSLLTPSSAGKEELELAISHTISHKAE